MAREQVKNQIISSSSPSLFCDNTGGLHNLRRQRNDEKEPREVLEDNNEAKHIFRVGDCRTLKIGDDHPYQQLYTEEKIMLFSEQNQSRLASAVQTR